MIKRFGHVLGWFGDLAVNGCEIPLGDSKYKTSCGVPHFDILAIRPYICDGQN